ncbi:hypothetical protein SAMN00017405_2236 [Desulfonispora thiosulfatigenes DSM 11270]|uniref:Uncharacterized protein n=1 Tax=Desulfonispora thiosulfatigenes DSM 11270 TaxID=656914 RepID=A0A1W1VEH3_DESTI|nr:DsrE family protein [Desulfonispora thiosulfatigenes]SMB91716.1 hypothetical protein SAMN00017405_2236 [Desulfonispora thiosulfatigenes DSM 11270]
MKKYKALFHVDEKEKIMLVLKNMANLLNDLGEDEVEVALVGNSEGIALMYQSSEYKEKVEALYKKGISFAACANTMKEKKLNKEDLLEFAYIVPSGVGEIVKKQAQGYFYIRP